MMFLSDFRFKILLVLVVLCGTALAKSSSSDGQSQTAHLNVRQKRQADLTSLIIAGARDILNSGGGEAIRNSPDKTSALMGYVKQFAMRRVLGDGLVGQVLGRGLLGNSMPSTTTQPSVGFFKKIFGGGKDTTTPASSNTGSSHSDRSPASGSSSQHNDSPVNNVDINTNPNSESHGSDGSSSSDTIWSTLAKKLGG